MKRWLLFCLLLLLPGVQLLLSCNSQRYRLRTDASRELDLDSRIRSRDSLAVLSHHQREDLRFTFHDQQVLIRPIGAFSFHSDSGFHGEAAYLLWNRVGEEMGQVSGKETTRVAVVETADQEFRLAEEEQTAFQESHREVQAVASSSIWGWLVAILATGLGIYLVWRKWFR